jgi:hypothetical protein
MDEDRPGRPPSITVEQVEAVVVVATPEETPTAATHWSGNQLADRSGLNKSTIGRSWRSFAANRTWPTASSCRPIRCWSRRSSLSSGCT